jgi:cyanobactin maturation PatA/PatG family protease
LDSFVQDMAGRAGLTTAERVMGFNPQQMLAHLEQHPHYAAALEWTLILDGSPVYAIRPLGPFAAEVYRQLHRFLHERLTEGVERVSITGFIAGQTTLLMGQVVPVIVPDPRGMFSWTTAALMERVLGSAPTAVDERARYDQRQAGFQNFLHRVYHELHNLGVLPQERALNYAATNAFTAGRIFEDAMRQNMELESVNVVRSPVGRPGSDCWDVEVYFFYPERQVQTVRLVYRFTVDVSDVVPVTIGQPRSWFTR